MRQLAVVDQELLRRKLDAMSLEQRESFLRELIDARRKVLFAGQRLLGPGELTEFRASSLTVRFAQELDSYEGMLRGGAVGGAPDGHTGQHAGGAGLQRSQSVTFDLQRGGSGAKADENAPEQQDGGRRDSVATGAPRSFITDGGMSDDLGGRGQSISGASAGYAAVAMYRARSW